MCRKFRGLIFVLSAMLCFTFPLPVFSAGSDWDDLAQDAIQLYSNKKVRKRIDKAIKSLSRQLSKDIGKTGESIAVSHLLTMDNKVTVLGNLLSEKLIHQFAQRGKLTPVERDFVFKLAEEMKLGMAGLVEDKTVQKAGRFLGATYVLLGTLENFGDEISVQARLVRTETSQIVRSAEATFKSNPDIQKLLAEEIELEPVSLKAQAENQKAADLAPLEAEVRVTKKAAPQVQGLLESEPAKPLILNQEYYETHYKPQARDPRMETQRQTEQERKDDEFYRRRLEELKEVGRRADEINKEVEKRAREREAQMDKDYRELWLERERERERRIAELNKSRFIIFVPHKNHQHSSQINSAENKSWIFPQVMTSP